jgi:peptidyl-prolyl cis-trans isomerase SurA
MPPKGDAGDEPALLSGTDKMPAGVREDGLARFRGACRGKHGEMRWLHKLSVGAVLALGLALTQRAGAVIVERVVAVVGERPILLTELRHRGRPFYYRILASTQDQAQQAAHETEMYKELLGRMIDDRLEETAADRAHLSVSSEELDNAIKNVATSNHLKASDLFSEAKKQGLTEQDYRDELRRQILEGKLMQLRVRSRVRVTDQDARAAYTAWLRDNGSQSQAEVRILAMRVTNASELKARLLLAENLVAQARAGEDFCKMVSEYSDDKATVTTCGSRGPLPMSGLVAEVQGAIRGLKPNEFSAPVIVGASTADQAQAILICELVSSPKVPTYDEVKDQMMERAFGDALERQRKIWLEELKHGVYVDIRL